MLVRTVEDADAVVGGDLEQEGVLEVGGRRRPPPRRHIAGARAHLRRTSRLVRVSCALDKPTPPLAGYANTRLRDEEGPGRLTFSRRCLSKPQCAGSPGVNFTYVSSKPHVRHRSSPHFTNV